MIKTIFAVTCLSLALCTATFTRADIFQWGYITPGDPGQGKQQSSVLVPDGEGVDALPGANLDQLDLTMAYLIGRNLTNASLFSATLTNADLTGADVRGASYWNLNGAVVTNLIQADGFINGLDLSAGQRLLVRDYDGNPDATPTPLDSIPITVAQGLAVTSEGVLELLFEADPWDSVISFEPGVPVSIEGTLKLDFAFGVELASQVGRTLDLFDWTGVVPTGVFTVESPYTWELSNLYSTGEVTLVAVPDPSADFDEDGDIDGADFLKSSNGNRAKLPVSGVLKN